MAFETELIGLAILFLWGGGKKKAAARPPSSAGSTTPSSAPPAAAGAGRPSRVGPDGEALLKRAAQSAAAAWAPTFDAQGVDLDQAEALARWAGIESSGNPLAVSSLGERGLLQVSAASQSDGALSAAEWRALTDPATSPDEHARMAVELFEWLVNRAMAHVADPPPPTDHESAMWYAKMYHARPVDVRDGKFHGPARAMARELFERWRGDETKLHRLRAANVVAFGEPNP